MKYTAQSPANIAFIKYWGAKDSTLFLPYNNSISMNISGCITTTTATIQPNLPDHDVAVSFNGKEYESITRGNDDKKRLLFEQIDRIAILGGIKDKIKIRSQNNFLADAGIASSASGFSALTLAVAKLAGLDAIINDKQELSKLIRLGGSVSAMRSAHDGFVECVCVGDSHDDCYAVQLATPNHWDLADIVVVVASEKKSVSSSQGHQLVASSEFFQARLDALPDRLQACREAILAKDFALLGQCIEADAISMHSVMMTSNPPIFYWTPETMRVILAVQAWRKEGIQSYFTIDAGANVHVICQVKDMAKLNERLKKLAGVQFTILNQACDGARLIDQHLF